MPINEELRSQGIGASEIAAIIGLDPRRDAFSVYVQKLGLVDRPPSNQRMRRGKYFERGVVDWYSDETGLGTEWSDITMQPRPDRPWHISTPDAFVFTREGGTAKRVGGVDAKTVAWDQRDKWGESGSTVVPDYVGCQAHWSCSAFDLPWWDIAAAVGMDELRIFRINRDPDTEGMLLQAGEKFWKDHILKRVPPPIGYTDEAEAYLKKRFPAPKLNLKVATPEESALLENFRIAKEKMDEAEKEESAIGNQIRMAIGEYEGVLDGNRRLTWTKNKDTMGTDWQAVAQSMALRYDLLRRIVAKEVVPFPTDEYITNGTLQEALNTTIEQLEAENQIVTRVGPRVLRCNWNWKQGKK